MGIRPLSPALRLLLFFVFFAFLSTVLKAFPPAGDIRAACPDGWIKEDFPGSGFKYSLKKEIKKGPPVLGVDIGIASRWEKIFDPLKNAEDILAFLKAHHPEMTEIRKLDVDGFSGYLVTTTPAFQAGGHGEGYFNSRYGFLGRGMMKRDEAFAYVYFDAWAVGEYTNENRDEVISLGQQAVAQVDAVLASLRINYVPPGGSVQALPAAPVKETPAGPAWLTLVGAGAAGLLLVAAAAAALLAKKKGSDGDQRINDYILQISKNTIDLSVSEQDVCEATVWEVSPDGSRTVAAGAGISLQIAAEGNDCVAIKTIGGQGRAEFTLKRQKLTGPAKVSAVIEALAGGTRHSATVTILLACDLRLEVRGSRERDTATKNGEEVFVIRQNSETGGWDFGEIEVFFSDEVTGSVVIPQSAVEFAMPRLAPDSHFAITPIAQLNDRCWTCRLSIKPGVELPHDWLAEDGYLHIEVEGSMEVEG